MFGATKQDVFEWAVAVVCAWVCLVVILALGGLW